MIDSSKIWVVDDDKEDQLMLAEYFSDIGIAERVEYFDNGRQAITRLESADQKAWPKLIVLDLNMPILNGTQTLLEIKRDLRLKEIPVIIFSTSENDNEKRKCLSFGALDYLVKPMGFEEGQHIARRFATYLNN